MTMPNFETWWEASLEVGAENVARNVKHNIKQLLRAAYEQGFVDGQYKVERDGPAPNGEFYASTREKDDSIEV
jgi:hypothetical protein